MEAKNYSVASPAMVKTWYEEFGLIPRFPRPPDIAIRDLWKGLQQPTIFLREDQNHDEIVVRVQKYSNPFHGVEKKRLARFGLTLTQAFEDVLRDKLEANRNRTWVELAGRAAEAYRRTWLRFFKLVYFGHFHPIADKWLKDIERELATCGKLTQPGRAKTTLIELGNLYKRYAQLLKSCHLIHRAAERVASPRAQRTTRPSPTELRRAIFHQIKKHIHGMPGDGYIFGGEAFKRIPHRKSAQMHDPQSWRPHQLAIALLTFERMQAYQTIEKKIALSKTRRRRSPSVTRR